MDNITIRDMFPMKDVPGNDQQDSDTSASMHPYLWTTSYSSTQDIYNYTQTPWTSADTVDVYNSTKTPWTSADMVALSATAVWLYLAVRIIWGVLAILGNSLTILAVVKFERLQTCTNYFICSLAVSDLLVALMVPSLMVHDLYPNSRFFVPACLLEKILNIISLNGNMWSILYLSIDRYIYIAFPLRYHGLVTARRVAIILTITWTYCLLNTPTLVFIWNHLHVGMLCKYLIFLNLWVTRIILVPQFFLPFILTIGFHLAIARIAYTQGRRIQAEQQAYNTLDVAINQSTNKIRHTLGTVLGIYIFSIIPQLVVGALVNKNRHLLLLERFTMLIYKANTWVNPLIYAWRLKVFRIAFKKIFTGTGSFNEVPGYPA